MSDKKRNLSDPEDCNGGKHDTVSQECERCNMINSEECNCIERLDCCEQANCCDTADIVLNAATGGAGPLPVIVIGTLTQALSVVSVTVDIGRKCDPSVLLKFTTMISLPAEVETTVTATLNFEVVRSVINGEPVKVGPTFTYSAAATTLVTDSFAFQLFDSDLKGGTYTYTVQLSTNTAVSLEGAVLINSTLSAAALLTD